MGMGRAESEEHERERMLLGKNGHQEKTGKITAIGRSSTTTKYATMKLNTLNINF